jgi:endonuclease/exonuclease/phosphatase family metal-dependent hydrolase
MRLLSWNLYGRLNVQRQLAAIAGRAPDIVAFQEVTPTSIGLLRLALLDFGMSHVVDSFATSVPWAAIGPRRYGVLIASRFPLTVLISKQVLPWPERSCQ